MKKLNLIVASAAVLIAAPAMAADLRPMTKAPPMMAVAPAFSWTGCYIGGYVGGAGPGRDVEARSPESTGGVFPVGTYYNAPNANAANLGRFDYDKDASFIGGGTLGCNYQFTGSAFVIGIEGEGGYMRLQGDRIDPYSIGPGPGGIGPVSYGGDTSASTRVGDYFAALTGRLGFAVGQTLFYAKGGVGFSEIRSSVIDNCVVAPCGAGTLNANFSDSYAFGVIGGGIEWAFSNNWSIKAEYLYLALDEDYRVCGPGGGTAAGSTFCSDHRVEGIHTGKVGLNYRFGAAPVVARY